MQVYAKLPIIHELIPQIDQGPVRVVGCNGLRRQSFACNQLIPERDSLSFIGIFSSCAKLFLSETRSKIRFEDSALPHQGNQFAALKNVASHLMNYRKSDKPVTG